MTSLLSSGLKKKNNGQAPKSNDDYTTQHMLMTTSSAHADDDIISGDASAIGAACEMLSISPISWLVMAPWLPLFLEELHQKISRRVKIWTRHMWSLNLWNLLPSENKGHGHVTVFCVSNGHPWHAMGILLIGILTSLFWLIPQELREKKRQIWPWLIWDYLSF